jgi:hypothetical protein
LQIGQFEWELRACLDSVAWSKYMTCEVVRRRRRGSSKGRVRGGDDALTHSRRPHSRADCSRTRGRSAIYDGAMGFDDREALRRLIEEEGDEDAAAQLVELAVAEEDLDLLRSLVDSGVDQAGGALAQMAAEQHDIATLKWLVDADHDEAAVLLGEIADASGDEALRQYLVDCGNEPRANRDS